MHTSTKSDFRKKEIAILFLLAMALFALPSLMRWTYFDNPSIIGFPTYLHQRVAEDILNGKFNGYDALSFGGREYMYPLLFSLGIAFFAIALPIQIAGMLFVVIFGAVSIVFFYLIVRNYISKKYAFLSSLILLLIPGTIYFNSHLSSRAPPFALGMAAVYFLLRGGRKNLSTAGVLLGIAALFHPETAIFFGIVSLLLAAKNKKILFPLLIAILIASAYYLPFLAAHGLPEMNALHEEYRARRYSLETPSINNFFFELNMDAYITFPIAILAAIGVPIICKKYRKNVFFVFWLLFALISAIAAERFLIYLAVTVAFLAAYAIIYLESRLSKRFFLAVIIAVLVYSSIFAASKITYFANSYPTKEQYNAMLWIKENTSENSTVLSDWVWGHWITDIAERKTFVDGYAEYAPDVNKRFALLSKFYSECAVPEGYNIGYIYMEDWFADKMNITCLDRFPLLYDKDSIKIYKA
jgi:asparagine N-glycosylation enzyme membrane subunit Stt3